MLASGSGGNGNGRRRTISNSVRAVGSPSRRSRHTSAANRAAADAEPGEPVDVGHPAVAGQPPVRAEPGVGVDRARPPMREPDVLEWQGR